MNGPGVSWVVTRRVQAADVPNPGDSFALFTPSEGMVVLSAFPDPRTFEAFESDGDPIILIGQASELPDDYWAVLNAGDGFDYEYANSHERVPLAEPVVAMNSPDGGALTGGRVDYYFEVAVPASP